MVLVSSYVLSTLNLYLYCVFLAGTPIFTPRGTLRARHEWEYYVEKRKDRDN